MHINKTHKYVREGGKVQGGLVDISTSSSSCRHCICPEPFLNYIIIGMQFPYPKVSLKCRLAAVKTVKPKSRHMVVCRAAQENGARTTE